MSSENIRGYVRPSARHRADAQKRTLIEAGAGKVYVEGESKETWTAFVRSLRHGDTAIVVSLARIAPTRDGIRHALRDVAERGAVLQEVATGRRIAPDQVGAALAALEAADELAQNRRAFTPREAKSAAAKRWRSEDRAERTPRATALRIWTDVRTYPRADDALDHPDMLGWSRPMAQRILGRRWPDYPGGRPRKLKT